MAGLAHDLRYAVRILRRERRFALIAALTMAVGIGATTTLFSVAYGVLMKPLPWPNAGRLIELHETRGGRPPRFLSFTNAAFLTWADRPATIDGIAAWSQRNATLFDAGDPERILVTSASPALFPVLGARPLSGALFDHPSDADRAVIVLSEQLWRRHFNADPHVVDRTVRLDGDPYRVIGVLPDALAFPDRLAQAFIPMKISPTTGNQLSLFHAVACLRPGVTAAQAAAEGTARGQSAADTGMTTMAIFGNRGPVAIAATPLREALTADVKPALLVLLTGVGLLFAAAIANIAGLQLARATTRRREMAIRAALGAARSRVTRQLLIEGLLLGSVGGVLGLAVSIALHRSLPTLLPAGFPRADGLGIDGVVVTFALLASVVTGVLCGLVPARGAGRVDLTASLSEDRPGLAGVAAGSGTGRSRFVIIAGQIAAACILLVGATLLGRSFFALIHADRGYDPTGVMVARVSFPSTLFTPERRFEVTRRILERMAGLPGVTDAAFTSDVPLTPGGSTAAFTIPAAAAGAAAVSVQAAPRVVSPRYFAALRLRVVSGRAFTDDDRQGAPPAIVVNRAFARKYLGDAALGARLPMAVGYGDDGTLGTVVGVIDDVRYVTAADSSQPEVYYSYAQLKNRLPIPTVTWLVRAADASVPLGSALTAIVREADPQLRAEGVMTFEDRLVLAVARPRLYAVVLGGFAALALIVAGIGLFGALSYAVAQRTRELAVRSALGARPGALVWLVVRQGVLVTCAGLAVGLPAAYWTTSLMSALLYGIAPHDVATFVVVPAAILIVALLACWLPAQRAVRVDPVTALK